MDGVNYFLKYAVPCSHILCTVRGEITKEEFDKMKKVALGDGEVSKEFLEKVFFRAFERIEKVAEDLGKDKWDIEVIKEYFRVRHNPVLDKSDYPESFKEMCRVNVGKVIEEKEDGDVIVQYGIDSKRKVKKDYIPDVKIGDRVTIHWEYVIERV